MKKKKKKTFNLDISGSDIIFQFGKSDNLTIQISKKNKNALSSSKGPLVPPVNSVLVDVDDVTSDPKNEDSLIGNVTQIAISFTEDQGSANNFLPLKIQFYDPDKPKPKGVRKAINFSTGKGTCIKSTIEHQGQKLYIYTCTYGPGHIGASESTGEDITSWIRWKNNRNWNRVDDLDIVEES